MANENFINNNAALLINGEVGADFAFSVEGLTNANGRVSAQIDLGAVPRPSEYQWSCEVQFQATPTQFASLDLYIAKAPDGDATQIDGDVGNADAALADIDMRSNLRFIGNVMSENAAASEVLRNSGSFVVTTRFISIIAFNASGATVNATDSNFRFDLQPKYQQGQ